MRKFQAEKSVLMISIRNIIQKKRKHVENFKNQNIMLKKKNITDTSIYKIQKKQRCVFNYDAQILK